VDPARLLIAATIAAALLAADTPARAECIDQDLAEKASFKRKRRGRVPRDFVKAQRHEISASGGYFVSDLYSSTYILGGSYTYHMTEDTAVEASGWYTHNKADVVRAIEDGRATTLRDTYARTTFFAASLLWYPFHGKLQLGGSVIHFDLHLNAGVGVVDSPTSRGVTGIGGIGIKLFGGSAFAFRIDLRDLVYKQELLMETFIVNDLSLTAGVSIFLPFGF
jgi:outer membrane beta-barrel protein